MTDERKSTDQSQMDSTQDLTDQIDALLPVPDDHGDSLPVHGQVDGPIDELLPVPHEAQSAADDASSREELEVDTTADGIDDIIPLDDSSQSSKSESLSDIVHPDSAETSESSRQHCVMCGETVGTSKYCPACGTEQVPISKFAGRFAPLFLWSRPLTVRATLVVAALLAVLALLADSGAIALIISAFTLPIVTLISIANRLDGWARTSWVQNGMMLLVGMAAGLPIAWIGTRIVKRSWFDGGVLQFGATSFGGVAAQNSGNAPFIVWLVVGILLPLVAILAITAAPVALRMALALNPREGTGMMMTSSAAAGYVMASATVFYWPLRAELAPIMSTSQWTLTILGLAVIRPLIWIYSGAMLGAVVWRYLRTASMPGIAIPGAIALGLPLAFSIIGLAVAPAGLWVAFIVGAVFALMAVYLYSRFLDAGRANDLRAEDTLQNIYA